MKTLMCCFIFSTLWLSVLSAPAAEDPHAHHAMPAPAVEGPWSYRSRNNPQPYTSGRWEMLPAPGEVHTYVKRESLSQAERCKMVQNNPRIMADRATREACGVVQVPEKPAAQSAVPHHH